MKVIESLGVKDDVLRKPTLARDGTETMRFVLEEKFNFGIRADQGNSAGQPRSRG